MNSTALFYAIGFLLDMSSQKCVRRWMHWWMHPPNIFRSEARIVYISVCHDLSFRYISINYYFKTEEINILYTNQELRACDCSSREHVRRM